MITSNIMVWEEQVMSFFDDLLNSRKKQGSLDDNLIKKQNNK